MRCVVLTPLRPDDLVLALLRAPHHLVLHDAHVLPVVLRVLRDHVREVQVPCGAECVCVKVGYACDEACWTHLPAATRSRTAGSE